MDFCTSWFLNNQSQRSNYARETCGYVSYVTLTVSRSLIGGGLFSQVFSPVSDDDFCTLPVHNWHACAVHGEEMKDEEMRNEQFKCKESKQQICPQHWWSHLWWELHQQIRSQTFLIQVRPRSSRAAGGPGCIPITAFLISTASLNNTLLHNRSQVIGTLMALG